MRILPRPASDWQIQKISARFVQAGGSGAKPGDFRFTEPANSLSVHRWGRR
ncbi:Uncharacterized protein dnm_061730 [Desulfonema magnum]|uniref:Uncharacterized protein n=1 Tax=Desulfonema magnum TaxID=45655 RepID=A0A975BR06_9BACT|nr:Uncharacterized protein dnm_061730 [Desulfonema magnum]